MAKTQAPYESATHEAIRAAMFPRRTEMPRPTPPDGRLFNEVSFLTDMQRMARGEIPVRVERFREEIVSIMDDGTIRTRRVYDGFPDVWWVTRRR